MQKTISIISSTEDIDARICELTSLYGFTSKETKESKKSRAKFHKMGIDEIKRIQKGTIL